MIIQLTKRERDTQRRRVYRCDPVLKQFNHVDVSTVPLMEDYVRLVWSRQRLHAAYPRMGANPPRVLDGRGRSRNAGGCNAYITMPRWSRTEAIVLHELAHSITQRQHGHLVAAHGWQYCEIYLTLVLHMMGRDAHDSLKLAFKLQRVRFTKPRAKRVLSPEERAALAARLSVYRNRLAAASDAG